MIDKLFPRILASSKDNRVQSRSEMNDALNVVATEDFNDVNDQNDNGNGGVLKPVKGNEPEPIKQFQLDDVFPATPVIQRRVLGQVTDPRSGMVFMFIYSETPSEQGVYAYDAYNLLGGGAGAWRPIYRTSEFQFSSTGRIKGDVVHVTTSTNQLGYRIILYFTDDVNEPRKLDVTRCIFEGFSNPTGNPINYTMNSVDDKDLITACPKAPIHPIQFTWQTTGENRISNFRRIPGLQFAFQCIYQTGEESAISTYSDIAVPEQYLRQGYYTNTVQLPQYLELVVPSQVDGVANFTEEIDRVRILVRRGNLGAWYEIDEVDWNGVGGTPIVYNFFNDRVLTGLTIEEQNRDYEVLPQLAQAVAVVENRLMYGNYVEGFDEVPLQATVNVNYYDRPSEFLNINIPATAVVIPLEPYSPGTPPSYVDTLGDPTEFGNRTTGVVLDFSQLPSTIEAGTLITVALRFDFGGSVEVYDATYNHHGSQIISDNNFASIAQTRDGNNTIYIDSPVAGQSWGQSQVIPMRSATLGVTSGLRWRSSSEVADVISNNNVLCELGTSGTTPLRFRGPEGANEQLSFSVAVRTNTTITDPESIVRSVILDALEYGEVPPGWTLENYSNQASYSYNLGLLDPDDNDAYNTALASGGAGNEDILSLSSLSLGNENNPQVRGLVQGSTPRYGIVPTINSTHLEYAKLISPVTAVEAGTGTNPTSTAGAAVGYIIVNSATLTFRLRGQNAMIGDSLGSGVLSLELASVSNSDVRTCVPIVDPASTFTYSSYGDIANSWLKFRGWRVFSGTYLSQNTVGTYNNVPMADYSAVFANLQEGTWKAASLGTRARCLGWLHVDGGEITPAVIPGPNLVKTNSMRRQEAIDALVADGTLEVGASEFLPQFDHIGISMVDGQLGLDVYQGTYNAAYGDPDGGADRSGFAFGPGFSEDIGCYGTMATIFGWNIWAHSMNANPTQTGNLGQGAAATVDGAAVDTWDLSRDSFQTWNCWERIGGQLMYDANGAGNADGDPFDGAFAWFTNPDGYQGPQAEVTSDAYLTEEQESGAYRSFKSSATHALGIVYYDERGRPGNVNPINPVYVPGYSPSERNGLGFQGRVDMTVNLISDPPQWAHFYQLVYAGSQTVQKFIQYSSAGAYIATSGDAEQLNNIYVSLNHLQFHPTVSYAEAFGAVHPDGTSDLYVYSPGDYLRVISYFLNDTLQIFPQEAVFEIAGQVTLTNDPESNPLFDVVGSDGVDVPDHLTGQFLILKDNISVTGMNWNAVAAEGNSGTPSTNNYWNNRCIFEIITPRKEGDIDNLVYRETSQVYNVGRNGNNVYHQTPVLLFQNGDVWWRAVAVNIQDYGPSGFVNLIQTVPDDQADEQPFANSPRFRNVYLESTTFTDTFPGADVNGLGKAKIYKPSAGQVRRFSSVIFGDENNYSVPRVRFTVFNPYLSPFKDLPNEHGAINALLNYNDSLFVVQEDKAGILPINRQVISDVLGNDSLIATGKVVGDFQPLPGYAGCDNNRESVLRVDDTIYFAHKSRNQVYRYMPGKGIEVISDAGMDSYFVDTFNTYGYGRYTRVVSGYDSLKDEYIITILTTNPLNEPGINQYTQPNLGLLTDVGIGDGGTGLGSEGEGVINWDTSYGGPASDYTDEIVNTGGTAPDGVAPGSSDGFPAPNGDGIGNSGNGVIDVADSIKDRIDAVINGTSGFDPPDSPDSYSNGANYNAGAGTLTIDTKGLIDSGVSETIGDYTFQAGAVLGSYNANAQTYTFSNVTDPNAIYSLMAQKDSGLTSGADYYAYLGEGDSILQGPYGLRTALEIRKYYIEDKKKQLVFALKNGAEKNLLDLIPQLQSDIEAVTVQLVQLGINNQPAVAALLQETNTAYDNLTSFAQSVMLSGSAQSATLYNGTLLVGSGIGSFTVNNYPLGVVEYNVLTQFNTYLASVGDALIPLLNLQGVDLSSAIGDLARSNSALRAQVDILTDQIQALSDATLNFGGNTLLPGVTSTQLESTTIDTIAQDGILTYNDVNRNFDALIQFIIDNNSVPSLELTNELGAQLVIEVLSDLGSNLLSQMPFVDTSALDIDASLKSYGEKSASQYAGLRQRAAQTSAVDALTLLDGYQNPFNITDESVITTSDLLASITNTGDLDAAGQLFNPFFFALPFSKVATLRNILIEGFMTDPDPYGPIIQQAEAANINIAALDSSPGALEFHSTHGAMRATLKNLEAGRYAIDLAAQTMTWIDVNLDTVEKPHIASTSWQQGYWNLTGKVDSATRQFQSSYNALGPLIPAVYPPGFVWENFFSQVTNAKFILLQLMQPYADLQVGTEWSPLLTEKFLDAYTSQDINDSTYLSNLPTMLNPLVRFGSLADEQYLTPDTVNTALVNAINTISNA